MTRPKSISKSNYFRLMMPFLLLFDDSSEENKEWLMSTYNNEQVIRSLGLASFILYMESVSFAGQGVTQELNEIINRADTAALDAFLDEDKGKKEPTHYNRFLEKLVFKLLPFHDAIDYEIGDDVDGDYEDTRFMLDYAADFLYPIIQKRYTKDFYPASMDLLPAARKEIPQLIDGYETYLSELTNASKRKICDRIEKEHGVANVRQEFDRYDRYFRSLTHGTNMKIPDDYQKDFSIPDIVKIEFLKRAFALAESLKA